MPKLKETLNEISRSGAATTKLPMVSNQRTIKLSMPIGLRQVTQSHTKSTKQNLRLSLKGGDKERVK